MLLRIICISLVTCLANGSSETCSGHGARVSGQCYCNDGYFGQDCELTPAHYCTAPNRTVICSGRGECKSGSCECYQKQGSSHKYSGAYCQCDDYSCPRNEAGELCGGPDNGVCNCGVCQCRMKYSGENCDCSLSTDTCIDVQSMKLCNGQGYCECGHCRCESNFRGATCELMMGNYRCHTFRQCVECRAFGTGELTHEECREECVEPKMNINVVDSYVSDGSVTNCSLKSEDDDCEYFFNYKFDNLNMPVVTVSVVKECPFPTTEHGGFGGSSLPHLTSINLIFILLLPPSFY